MIRFARRLEGLARNVGTHAAGVVIADRPLERLVPLQRLPNKDKEKEVVSTQWDMGDVEKAGLLKMDFLGLRNLTSLDAAVKLIKERQPDARIDLHNLPLDDEETYKLLQRGETKGIFQLESAGIRDLLVKMKPDRFADIIATIALYRPGPLNGGMVDEYVNVKHGRKQASTAPGDEGGPGRDPRRDGLPGTGHADPEPPGGHRALARRMRCIKAISKKKTEVIAQGRKQFIEGAIERGLEKEQARPKIFDLIEFFGGYGFNKSHSTAYALVAFQTAYLKAHYPTEFMAALLSSEMDGAEREKFFVEHIEDCQRMGIEVLPPNINEGEAPFRVAAEGKIHFGLGAIKGVGLKAVEAIVKARERGGPFTEPRRLLRARPAGVVSQACVEALIKAGAFDCLGAPEPVAGRPPPAAQAGQASAGGPQTRPAQPLRRVRRGAADGFDGHGDGNGDGHASLPDIPELPDAERLGRGEEGPRLLHVEPSPGPPRRAAAGAGDAPHRRPGHRRREGRSHPGRDDHERADQERPEEPVRADPDGQAHLRGPDRHGRRRCSGPRSSPRSDDLVKNDLICFVQGTLDRRREPAELVISRIIPLESGPAELAAGVVVTLRKGVTEEEQMRAAAPPVPDPAREPRRLPRDLRPLRVPPGDLQGGR